MSFSTTRMVSLVGLFVCIACSNTPGKNAAEQVNSLEVKLSLCVPEDGSWAQYSVEYTGRHKEKLQIGSVGRTDVDGKKCCFLEMKSWREKETPHFIKVLIAEADLLGPENPVKCVIKGWEWRKGDADLPRTLARNVYLREAGMWLRVLFPNSIKETKKLSKATIATNLGKFECEGIAGSFWDSDEQKRISHQFQTWIHPSVPFNVVRFQTNFKGIDDEVGEGTMRLEISAKGTGAKSDMPELK